MKFSQLRSFHAVARTGSFSKAAELLHISQPTITAQVRELESYYRVQLLRRQRGNNQLTETGLALFQQTQMIFAHEKKARGILRSDGQLLTGTLKIGAVSPPFLVEILKTFRTRYPGIKLEIETGGSEFITHKVLSGSLDVGMVACCETDDRLFSLEFGYQRLILVAHRSNSIAKNDRVDLSILQNQPIIQREKGSTTRHIFERAMTKKNIRFRAVMEADSREAVRQATIAGLGLSYIGEKEFQPDPDLKPVLATGLDELSRSYIICHSDLRSAPMTNAFIELAIPLAKKASEAQMIN